MLQVEINASTLQCTVLDPINFAYCYVEYSYGEDCEASLLQHNIMSHVATTITSKNRLCYVAVAISNSASVTVILRGTYNIGKYILFQWTLPTNYSMIHCKHARAMSAL